MAKRTKQSKAKAEPRWPVASKLAELKFTNLKCIERMVSFSKLLAGKPHIGRRKRPIPPEFVPLRCLRRVRARRFAKTWTVAGLIIPSLVNDNGNLHLPRHPLPEVRSQ